MRKLLTSLARQFKRTLLIAFDLAAIWFCLWLAFTVRLGSGGFFSDINTHYLVFLLLPLCLIPHCIQCGLYRTVVRYSGGEVISSVSRATLYGILTFVVIYFLLPLNIRPQVPRSIPIIFWAFATISMAGGRLLISSWLSGHSLAAIFFDFAGIQKHGYNEGTPVAIYGAGAAGRQLKAALLNGNRFRPVAFIDNDEALWSSVVSNIKVFPPHQTRRMLKKTGAREILLAIPSATRAQRKKIITELESFDIHIRTVPGLEEIALEGLGIQQLKEVSVADILGRDAVEPNPELLARCITGKSVMVTGAGGSIGSELCRQILQLSPRQLVLFENSEYNLYQIHQELEGISQRIESPSIVLPVLGSVTQPWRLLEVMNHFEVESVYHAAAYKHVPIVEHNSHHGFRNNVLGTLYTAQAAVISKVENFVLISTDKAVRPTNIMGTTKRLAELVLQAISAEKTFSPIAPELFRLTQHNEIENHTRFTMVRFGNVLDSSGSVVPLFRQQIKSGGPVTVTHPEIIRYFMTIPEAAQLVIQAGSMGKGGDVFVLDMGEPVKIAQLAAQLIHLSGLTIKDENNPFGDIEIEYSGLRPGEKLYEELLIGDNVFTTEHPKIMRANEAIIPWPQLIKLIDSLSENFRANRHSDIRQQLISLAEISYRPLDEIGDWLGKQEPGTS